MVKFDNNLLNVRIAGKLKRLGSILLKVKLKITWKKKKKFAMSAEMKWLAECVKIAKKRKAMSNKETENG